jgi:ubiquinone biosynthesis accessory factor UbiK
VERRVHAKFVPMSQNPFASLPPLPKSLTDLQDRVSGLMKSAPAVEVEKHMKSAMSAALGKMDMVTRDDFEIQQQMLARALEKLAALEKRLADLEASSAPPSA